MHLLTKHPGASATLHRGPASWSPPAHCPIRLVPDSSAHLDRRVADRDSGQSACTLGARADQILASGDAAAAWPSAGSP
jgi:hypothetical protein